MILLFLNAQTPRLRNTARDEKKLLRYVEGVHAGEHRLTSYLSALTHFEQCIGAVWQAAELFNRMEHKVQNIPHKKLTLYEPRQNSVLQRNNSLNNIAKHFNADQAAQTSTPIWITNAGLKSTENKGPKPSDIFLTFDELQENVMALSEVARQTFVEIPKEARARRRGLSSGAAG